MELIVSGGDGRSVRRASCRLPSVADRPHTISRGCQPASRASANCTCTPRLLPISSCHSSTTTSRTLCRLARASARASSSDTLSGVLTSTVGRRRAWAARSAADVSPLRRPLVQCGAMSASGSRRARSVSAASARIGVIHSTVIGGAGTGFEFAPAFVADGEARVQALAENACKAPSHTAQVLPAPVVACTRPLRPSAMARQTCC